MKNFLLIILMILLIPFRLNAITRDEAVSAAEAEANKTYSSAQFGEALFNNVFHPKYRFEGTCADHSTLPECSYKISGNDTTVYTFSWTGAPYCYGGNYMGDDCQNHISSGYAVGAHKCHYDHYSGEDINDWAAGIDCSAFVCTCLGLGTDTKSSELPSKCTEINWGDLQPGDLIINPGSHVVMFIGWIDQEQGSMYIAEAKGSLGEVEEHSSKKKDYEDNGYHPYKPNCIAGEPAAKVAGFKVEVEGGVVHLSWKTECERDTGCFWIERATSKNGPWERITDDIPSKGSSTSGAKYEVVDEGYGGGRVFYRLMEREVGYRVLVDRVETYKG